MNIKLRFQNGQTAVYGFVMALAIALIQVGPAPGAKSPAIFMAEDFHGDLQHDLLDDQRIEINEVVLIIDEIQIFLAAQEWYSLR